MTKVKVISKNQLNQTNSNSNYNSNSIKSQLQPLNPLNLFNDNEEHHLRTNKCTHHKADVLAFQVRVCHLQFLVKNQFLLRLTTNVNQERKRLLVYCIRFAHLNYCHKGNALGQILLIAIFILTNLSCQPCYRRNTKDCRVLNHISQMKHND